MLLDEPLSNLDVGFKQELLGLFRELLHERGTTALYVTHDPREAQALGDRAAVLEQGRIVHLGRLEELRSRPDLPFARGASSNRSGDASPSPRARASSVERIQDPAWNLTSSSALILVSPQRIAGRSLR